MIDPVAALVAAIDAQDCASRDHILCPDCVRDVLARLTDQGLVLRPAEGDGGCGTHHPTDKPSVVLGWPLCCCGKPWLTRADRCATGARPGDRVAASEQEHLRARLVSLSAWLLRLRTFDNDDPADEETRQIAVALRDEADGLTRPRATT